MIGYLNNDFIWLTRWIPGIEEDILMCFNVALFVWFLLGALRNVLKRQWGDFVIFVLTCFLSYFTKLWLIPFCVLKACKTFLGLKNLVG